MSDTAQRGRKMLARTMPQRRQYRRKRGSSDEEEQEGGENQEEEVGEVSKKLEEAKELQKFRKRPAGVSAVGLAFGKKFTEEEKLAPDPFKLKSGGLVDLKELTTADLQSADDEVLQRLSSTFSAETKTRDDEAHMLKYIEEEMAKRKKGGPEQGEEDATTYEAKIKALYQLPDRLKVEGKSSTEEMLSNQMLSGIPEVDLGLEARFRNIEETELAKQTLIEEQRRKRQEKKESLVPRNMAVNYTHHSLRFYKEKETHSAAAPNKKVEKEQPAYIPVVGENEPELKPTTMAETHKRKVDHSQMATDDFHYDKYRKKARRF